jgi:hypothetical protein
MPSAACEAGDGGAVDYISDLGDDLLLHILRFMTDARDVVCTSTLSTRWRNLWTRTRPRAPPRDLDPQWPELQVQG